MNDGLKKGKHVSCVLYHGPSTEIAKALCDYLNDHRSTKTPIQLNGVFLPDEMKGSDLSVLIEEVGLAIGVGGFYQVNIKGELI